MAYRCLAWEKDTNQAYPPCTSLAAFVGNGLNFFFGNRVSVNPSPSLDFEPGKSFTIDAWIKGHGTHIVGNYNMSTKTGYHVYIASNNTLSLDMGDTTQLTTWNGPAFTPGVWTFVAVVVDRTSPNKTVTFYTGTGNSLSAPVHAPILNPVNASSSHPLDIGTCPGNPNGCDTIIDEVEIFNRALMPAEIQGIFNGGSAGKCKLAKGMTWIHGASNAQTGTITVGCGSSGPNPCDAYHGDTVCTQPRPLLCIYKPTPAFPVPKLPLVDNSDQYNRWSGGVVATTQPVAGSTFLHISATPGTDANSYCQAQFGSGWRVAEFHDGWGWNFQAYGGTVSAPAVPSTRFWVHINDQPAANCWATP